MKRLLSPRAGFTLLEIMLVVLIIGLLIGMAIRFTGGNIGIAQETAVKGHIETYKMNLMTYQMTNGSLPSTAQGLKALISKPEGEPKARQWRQLMDAPTTDPWGQEYFYVQPGVHNPSGYDIYSAGPDRKAGNEDDQGNWKTEQ